MVQSDQKRLLFGTLKILSNRYLNALGQGEGQAATQAISAAAKAISRITGNDSGRQELLREWLISSSGAGMGEAVGVRRATVAVFGQDRDLMLKVLTDSLNQFGDQLYIRHAPSLQQEGWLMRRPATRRRHFY
jgi:telomere length regulation protein